MKYIKLFEAYELDPYGSFINKDQRDLDLIETLRKDINDILQELTDIGFYINYYSTIPGYFLAIQLHGPRLENKNSSIDALGNPIKKTNYSDISDDIYHMLSYLESKSITLSKVQVLNDDIKNSSYHIWDVNKNTIDSEIKDNSFGYIHFYFKR